jgi:outer membrane protein W
MISGKDEFGRNIIDISEFNQFGVLGGAGLDYKLNNNLYIRGQVMLQMRFANKAMKDIVASEKKEAEALKNIPGIATDIKTTLGLGPVIRISVGTRF